MRARHIMGKLTFIIVDNYEFRVVVSITVIYKYCLVVGMKAFPGNPYDDHTFHKQLKQTRILLEDSGVTPKQVMMDLRFLEVDADNPNVEIIHRGKSLTKQQRRWFKRTQAVERSIRYLQSDHRMDRCWLKKKLGVAYYGALCAMDYNLPWLL